MAPSLKTLRKFWDQDTAKQLRGLLDMSADPEQFPGVAQWVSRCFHRPSRNELVMEAVNELIGGFGVESICGRYVDSYCQDIQAVYCNMGDTYDITILLDHETGNFVVTSWGDWYEAKQKTRELV